MSWIWANLNLIFIIFIVASLIYGFIRGFFAQLGGFIVTIVAIIVASIFAKPLLQFISSRTSFVGWLAEKISGLIDSAFPSLKTVDFAKISESVASLPLPSAVKDTVLKFATEKISASVNLNQSISQAISSYIILMVCYSIIFTAVKLVCLLLKNLSQYLRQIQILKITDSILGVVLALTKAIIIIYAFVFAVKVLPFSWLEPAKASIDNSKLLTFMLNHNLFNWLFGLMKI